MRTRPLSAVYRELLEELHVYGIDELNSRTGAKIRLSPGGHSFKLDISSHIPVPGNRRYWPRVAASEVAWQFLGTKDPLFIIKHAPKLWSAFVEDGELKSAYGYRWRKHFGRDQIEMALEELSNNPTNRQLYISAWDPARDGLGAPDQPKNLPCPVGFSLTRTGGHWPYLHCSVFIRSSDVFVGLPYDIMAYTLTTAAMARSVGCFPGTLHVTLAHPHYYHVHKDAIEECLEGDRRDWEYDVEPKLPTMSVEDIVSQPDRYVEHVKRLSKYVNHNPWNPMPELVV